MKLVKQKRLAVLISAVAMAAAGCGSAGKPVDPAPVTDVQPPQPAHVGGVDAGGPGSANKDCNTGSLAPNNGTGIPSGSTMAKIKERGKLIAGVDQTTFLFGFRNPTNGSLEGFDIDIAKQVAIAIFGTAENRIQFRAITSSQREAVLERNEVDIVVRTYTINCDRLKRVNFSTAYYVAGQRVLVPNSVADKVDGLEDLGGQKVCAAKGSTPLKTIAAAPSKPVPVSVDNWSDCLVMLQQGQVAAVSTDDVILVGMAEQDPTTRIVGDKFTREPYGIGIPKANEDMVRFVNAVLDNVRAGPWRQSYDKWLSKLLGDGSPPPAEYK
ncbi:glutamate ABC transporter substrate-binding protein [Amycolatopsis nigrescens]|uniref:glutamate ABC transporter substrate-binding protein n=1 Tax=Amycolatopsis nigrescens TaxID=381445 RepID=UPI00037F7C0C|nr:glutamate ABC transporter substrate-binding protein [Amycolatopsis nigrescens]